MLDGRGTQDDREDPADQKQAIGGERSRNAQVLPVTGEDREAERDAERPCRMDPPNQDRAEWDDHRSEHRRLVLGERTGHRDRREGREQARAEPLARGSPSATRGVLPVCQGVACLEVRPKRREPYANQ